MSDPGKKYWAGTQQLEHDHRTEREKLVAAMGLRYDPFTTAASESDLAPDFGAIYIDPQSSLLDSLKRSISTFVFADYGMGKTATRLALEYTLRNDLEDYATLSVTYIPNTRHLIGQSAQQVLARHLEAIAAAMVDDLVIQVVERLSNRSLVDLEAWLKEQQTIICQLAHALSARLRRAVQIAASKLGLGSSAGGFKANEAEPGTSGAFWRAIRPTVQHIARTPQWAMLVQLLADSSLQSGPPKALPWTEVVAHARRLGFPRAFVLIDAIDDRSSTAEELRHVMMPLLDQLGEFQQAGVFLKCFLPALLELDFRTGYERQFQSLTVVPEIATILHSSAEHLHSIINERLQVAGRDNASFRSLDWFQRQDISGSIQQSLVELAQGSPRRMIEFASELLQFHSFHGFQDNQRLWITADEWQAFLEQLKGLYPTISPGV